MAEIVKNGEEVEHPFRDALRKQPKRIETTLVGCLVGERRLELVGCELVDEPGGQYYVRPEEAEAEAQQVVAGHDQEALPPGNGWRYVSWCERPEKLPDRKGHGACVEAGEGARWRRGRAS